MAYQKTFVTEVKDLNKIGEFVAQHDKKLNEFFADASKTGKGSRTALVQLQPGNKLADARYFFVQTTWFESDSDIPIPMVGLGRNEQATKQEKPSENQKPCPKCGTIIPKTWMFHQGCGWKSGEKV